MTGYVIPQTSPNSSASSYYLPGAFGKSASANYMPSVPYETQRQVQPVTGPSNPTANRQEPAYNMRQLLNGGTTRDASGLAVYTADFHKDDSFNRTLNSIQANVERDMALKQQNDPQFQALMAKDNWTRQDRVQYERALTDAVDQETSKVPAFSKYRNSMTDPHVQNIHSLNDLSQDIDNGTQTKRFDCGVETWVKGAVTQRIEDKMLPPAAAQNDYRKASAYFLVSGGVTFNTNAQFAGNHASLYTPAGNMVEETVNAAPGAQPYKEVVGQHGLQAFLQHGAVTTTGEVYGQRIGANSEMRTSQIAEARKEQDVATIQTELAKAGLYKGEPTGAWDPQTNKGFHDYMVNVQTNAQKAGITGVPVNGRFDNSTLQAITQMSGTVSRPMMGAIVDLQQDGTLNRMTATAPQAVSQQPYRPAAPVQAPAAPQSPASIPQQPYAARPIPAATPQSAMPQTPGAAPPPRLPVTLYSPDGRPQPAAVGPADMAGRISIYPDPRLPGMLRIGVGDPARGEGHGFIMSARDTLRVLEAGGPAMAPLIRQVERIEIALGERKRGFEGGGAPGFARGAMEYGRPGVGPAASEMAYGRHVAARDAMMVERAGGVVLRESFGGAMMRDPAVNRGFAVMEIGMGRGLPPAGPVVMMERGFGARR